MEKRVLWFGILALFLMRPLINNDGYIHKSAEIVWRVEGPIKIRQVVASRSAWRCGPAHGPAPAHAHATSSVNAVCLMCWSVSTMTSTSSFGKT